MLRTAILSLLVQSSDAYGNVAGPTDPPAPITSQYVQECVAGFAALNFNVYDYARYPQFFHDNSSVTLSQAGTYFGAEDIEEYMRFGSDSSPWVHWQGAPVRLDFTLQPAETTALSAQNKCVFNQAYQQISMTTPESFNITIDRAVFVKHTFDKAVGKVDQMVVFFDIPWFDFYFGLITGPDAVRFTCNVMKNECASADLYNYNSWTTVADCEAAMMALPIFSDNEIRYIDGLTRSCRQLHVAFAVVNEAHCPHLSIKPMADRNGKFKCQYSQKLHPDMFFNDADMGFWELFKSKIGLNYGTFSEPKPRITCAADSECPAFQWCSSEGCVFGHRKSLGNRVVANIWSPEALPLNEADCIAQGWTIINETASCDPLVGKRYRYQGFLTPTIMIDNLGLIAGIQMSIDTATFPVYPESNLRSPPFFRATGDSPTELTYSWHFKDPAKLCTAHPLDHLPGSIGDRFWPRKSHQSNMEADFMVFPLEESKMQGGMPDSGWVQGGCAPANWIPGALGMGTHYWQYLDKFGEMEWAECYGGGPIALMYAWGKLATFSVVAVGSKGRLATNDGLRPINTVGKERSRVFLWEFPTQPADPLFFKTKNNPGCLAKINTWDGTLAGNTTTTLLHFHLWDNNNAISCAKSPNPSPPPAIASPPPNPARPPVHPERATADLVLLVAARNFRDGALAGIIVLAVLFVLTLGCVCVLVSKEKAGKPAFGTAAEVKITKSADAAAGDRA